MSDEPISLNTYLNMFVENSSEQGMNSDLELPYYLETLRYIPQFQISSSQLSYVAGYAVFSYIKKSKQCCHCHNFLTTDKQMEVINDIES